jgi:hypothetical protein
MKVAPYASLIAIDFTQRRRKKRKEIRIHFIAYCAYFAFA